MIRAVMYWERLRIEVDGHAGCGEKGQDIVCAGASMLTNALTRTLEEAEMRGRCEMKARNRDGSAVIWANPTMGALNEVKAYFRMVTTGMRMLQEAYPGKVILREVR